MKKYFLGFLLLLLSTNLVVQSAGILKLVEETKVFVYYCTPPDRKAVEDIKKVLEEHYPRICKELQFQYSFKIRVEIYPNQAAYDENIIDPDVIGSPACSGQRRIFLVSPRSPIKVSWMSYQERLLMAVHEFAHLMINEINPHAPIWLQEGVASYEGSPEGYHTICQQVFSNLPVIQFSELEQSYHELLAPDVYSYSVIRFLIEKFGVSKLNQVIRSPENFQAEILKMTKDEFSGEWNRYLQSQYRNH